MCLHGGVTRFRQLALRIGEIRRHVVESLVSARNKYHDLKIICLFWENLRGNTLLDKKPKNQ